MQLASLKTPTNVSYYVLVVAPEFSEGARPGDHIEWINLENFAGQHPKKYLIKIVLWFIDITIKLQN